MIKRGRKRWQRGENKGRKERAMVEGENHGQRKKLEGTMADGSDF
jgi:hypothetical protein